MQKLDLGCGSCKKTGFIGLDVLKNQNVDIVTDLAKKRLPFKNNTVSEVFSSHFFEHIDSPSHILHEIIRVSIDNGKVEIWTPYLKSNDAFVFGHINFYNETIWRHICIDFPEIWFKDIEGALQLDRIQYVLSPEIESELKVLNIPLNFALRHMFNIATEFGVFMTVLKGPDAKTTAKVRRYRFTTSYSRSGPEKQLDNFTL
jgi:hypothetical protein